MASAGLEQRRIQGGIDGQKYIRSQATEEVSYSNDAVLVLA